MSDEIRPPVGDSAAWSAYWRRQGERNRDKCNRMAEIIRSLKTCHDGAFDLLASDLRSIEGDSAKDVIEVIRANRAEGKYAEQKGTKGERKWKQ